MQPPMQLVSRLRALLEPLVAIVWVTVWLSAPVLWLSFTVTELRLQANAAAAQLAERIGRESDEQPELWRYDSLKLLQNARPMLANSDLAAVRLVDHNGVSLDALSEEGAEQQTLVWQAFPVQVGGAAQGHVWVAASLGRALRTASILLAAFGLLAAGLGVLLWRVPLHAVRSAEQRLSELWDQREASRQALQRHNEELEVQVAGRTAELRAMSARATNVQAAERKALARELHDELGQTLTGLRLRLQVAANADPSLGTGVALVDKAIEGVRRAVLSLAPASLDELGLAQAIARLCEGVQESHGIAVAYATNLQAEATDAAVELAAYRITQEALTNVVRHSGAHRVEVSLTVTAESMSLLVCDDGKGIGAAPPRAGLTSMRERAALLGGTLQATAGDGGGTRIEAVLPLTPAGANPGSPVP